MKAVIITDVSPDYGADRLYDGFVDLCEKAWALDFPVKPNLHLGVGQAKTFDCDAYFPKHSYSADDIRSILSSRTADLIVVPTLRGRVVGLLHEWREQFKKNEDRVVYCDMEDHSIDTLSLFEDAVGFKPVAYFKRELPHGETWARPLAFGYPARDVVQLPVEMPDTREGAVYAAHCWPWAVGGLREDLAVALRDVDGVKVCLSRTEGDRMSIADYHALNRRALVAVSPAGYGYDTNRHLELIADGCCPVIESPWRQWPPATQLRSDAVGGWFRNDMECVDVVKALLAQPQLAYRIARRAQEVLLASETTKHRAEEIWRSVHGAH
jgi:hypothetical protein